MVLECFEREKWKQDKKREGTGEGKARVGIYGLNVL